MDSDYANIGEKVPTIRRPSAASAATYSDDDFGDDGDYEELPEDLCSMRTLNSLDRETGIIDSPTGRGVFKRSQSAGGSEDADDKFNTAKLQNIKNRLRPTVQNNCFQDPHNTEGNELLAVNRPNNHWLRQDENDVNKPQTTDVHEVGSGVESVRIKKIKNSLKSVQIRKESNDRQNYDFHQESTDGTDHNEWCSRVAAHAISKFNSPHQHIGSTEPPSTHPHITSIKASHAPKLNLAIRSSSNDSDSSTQSPHSNAGTTTPFRFKSSPSQRPLTTAKTSVTRFASVTLPTNGVSDNSDDDFGHTHQLDRLGNSLSEGRSDDNRISKGLRTRQDSHSIMASQKWYFGDIGRELAEERLSRMLNTTGSFMVRDSNRGGRDSPYALSVVYNGSIYHLIIRRRPDEKFSIGKPKLNEKVFNNVVEMIAFHQNNSLELIGDPNKRTASGKVTLKKCPTKN